MQPITHIVYRDGLPVQAPGHRHPRGDGDRQRWTRSRTAGIRQARALNRGSRQAWLDEGFLVPVALLDFASHDEE